MAALGYLLFVYLSNLLLRTHVCWTTNLGDYLQKLLDKLHQLEKDIMSEVLKVSYLSLSDHLETANEGVILHELGLPNLSTHEQSRRSGKLESFGRYLRFSKVLEVFIRRDSELAALFWGGMRFVLTFGQTLQLIRGNPWPRL